MGEKAQSVDPLPIEVDADDQAKLVAANIEDVTIIARPWRPCGSETGGLQRRRHLDKLQHMSTKMIEQELAEMKKRLEKLEANAAGQPRQDWRAGFGALKGSTFHREATGLVAEYRAKENKRQ